MRLIVLDVESTGSINRNIERVFLHPPSPSIHLVSSADTKRKVDAYQINIGYISYRLHNTEAFIFFSFDIQPLEPQR